MTNSVLTYLRDVSHEDAFDPRPVRDPGVKKMLDTRKLHRNLRNWVNNLPAPDTDDILTQNGDYYVNQNGVIYYYSIYQKQVSRSVNLRGRPRKLKKERHRNGRIAWYGYGDAWAKPECLGKSSRYMMQQRQEWREIAFDVLENKADYEPFELSAA